MGKDIEQDLLKGKIKLVDLLRDREVSDFLKKKLLFMRGSNDLGLTEDYFNKENMNVTYFKLSDKLLQKSELAPYKIPEEGIITQDGTIYTMRNLQHHLVLAMWLKSNGVDIRNSIRFLVWRSGYNGSKYGTPEFYDGYDSLKKYPKEPKNFDE